MLTQAQVRDIIGVDTSLTPETYRANCVTTAAENIADAAITLKLAASGELTDEGEDNIFGERRTIAQQVRDAEWKIARAVELIQLVM